MPRKKRETSTSTSSSVLTKKDVIDRREESRRGTPKDSFLGRVRAKVTDRCQLYDFIYSCPECGLQATLRDYTRPESRLCGRCDRKMSVRKVEV